MIGIGAQRIGNPGNVDWADGLEAGHDANVPVILPGELAGEAHGIGRGSSFCHLVDEAFGDAGSGRVIAGGVSVGDELLGHLPRRRRLNLC